MQTKKRATSLTINLASQITISHRVSLWSHPILLLIFDWTSTNVYRQKWLLSRLYEYEPSFFLPVSGPRRLAVHTGGKFFDCTLHGKWVRVALLLPISYVTPFSILLQNKHELILTQVSNNLLKSNVPTVRMSKRVMCILHKSPSSCQWLSVSFSLNTSCKVHTHPP